MNREEATVLVDRLLEGAPASTASWGERVLAYGRLERSGASSAIAAALATLYGESMNPAKLLMVERLESRLFPQLAAALGESEADLRARVHAPWPAFSGEVRLEDVPVPSARVAMGAAVGPAGWVLLHEFLIEGDAVVLGTDPDDDAGVLSLGAKPGTWLVFDAPRDGLINWLTARLGRPPERTLIAVHADHLREVELLRGKAFRIGTTEVHAGASSLVDSKARRDHRVLERVRSAELSPRSMTFRTFERTITWRGERVDQRLIIVRTDDARLDN